MVAFGSPVSCLTERWEQSLISEGNILGFRVITVHKRSGGKVMFYTSLSVILFRGGGVHSPWADAPGKTPPPRLPLHPTGMHSCSFSACSHSSSRIHFACSVLSVRFKVLGLLVTTIRCKVFGLMVTTLRCRVLGLLVTTIRCRVLDLLTTVIRV